MHLLRTPEVKNINENEHKNKNKGTNENQINSTLTCENLIFTSYKTYDTSRSRAECSSAVPFSSYFPLSSSLSPSLFVISCCFSQLAFHFHFHSSSFRCLFVLRPLYERRLCVSTLLLFLLCSCCCCFNCCCCS